MKERQDDYMKITKKVIGVIMAGVVLVLGAFALKNRVEEVE